MYQFAMKFSLSSNVKFRGSQVSGDSKYLDLWA